jgi:hypothetical protein
MFDTHDVSEVGRTPEFRRLVVIVLMDCLLLILRLVATIVMELGTF